MDGGIGARRYNGCSNNRNRTGQYKLEPVVPEYQETRRPGDLRLGKNGPNGLTRPKPVDNMFQRSLRRHPDGRTPVIVALAGSQEDGLKRLERFIQRISRSPRTWESVR